MSSKIFFQIKFSGLNPVCIDRAKPPYPSPPSYKSHPCYNLAAAQNGVKSYPDPPSFKSHPCFSGNGLTQKTSRYPQFRRNSSPEEYNTESPESLQGFPDSPHQHSPQGGGDIQFYDWEAVNMNTRHHKPDLSSDSDYFSTSTYRAANDNYKGKTTTSSIFCSIKCN